MHSFSVEKIKAVRYISLKKDWIRRFLLRILLRNLSCEKKWIPGVIYDAGNTKYKKYVKNGFAPYMKEKGNKCRQRGIIGCWIAHSHALEDINDREGISIIIEDDFICQPGFFQKAIMMLNEFDREFDIIVFDPSGSGPMPEHKICNNIYRNNGGAWPVYWGSHCLFVNNKSIPKILDDTLNSQVFDYDSYLIGNTELKVYLFYSNMSTVVDFGSNILPGNFTIKNSNLMGIIRWIKSRYSETIYVRRIT